MKHNVFLFIIMLVMSQLAYAQTKCLNIYSGVLSPFANLVGIAITYSPTLMLNNQVKAFPGHVLIESNSIESEIKSQRLLPFYSPISGIEPFGKKYFHDIGLLAIYQNYGDKITDSSVEIFKRVEDSLPLERQSTFIVRPASKLAADNVMGFIRVFDGSIYNNNVIQFANPALPLEKILIAGNKKSSIVNNMRAQGSDVFEIGKYYLNSSLPAKELKQVRTKILEYLKDYLESREIENLNKSYFFALTVTNAHSIAYRRFFGFEIVDKKYSQNLDAEENILVIRGDILLKNLKKNISL